VFRRPVKEGGDDDGDEPEVELDDGDEDRFKGGEENKGSELVEPGLGMSGGLVCILT
jgi:hypothetical protein